MSFRGEAIVETDFQRLDERVKVPAVAEIENQTYSVLNISKNGACLSGIIEQPEDQLALKLSLSIDDFNFNMTLDAEARHYDANQKTLGLRFTDANQRKLSFLAHIIRSYKSGSYLDGAAWQHLSHRPLYLEPPSRKMGRLRKTLSYFLIASMAIAAIFLLAFNFYQSVFTIKPPSAFVTGHALSIKAAQSGSFTSLLSGQNHIRVNEILGRVGTTPIVSPCECLINESHVADGEIVSTGATLFTLLRLQPYPDIEALLPMEDAQRLRLQIPADIRIPGSGIVTKAKIKSVLTAKDQPGYMIARLTPLTPVPSTLHNSPVKVRFNLR